MFRRLIRIAFHVGATVKFLNNDDKGIFTIIKINNDGTYNILNKNSSYDNIDQADITESNNFIVGDKVIFKNHPYDNTDIFVIKEILPNDNYFISSDKNSYTNINKINLELVN